MAMIISWCNASINSNAFIPGQVDSPGHPYFAGAAPNGTTASVHVGKQDKRLKQQLTDFNILLQSSQDSAVVHHHQDDSSASEPQNQAPHSVPDTMTANQKDIAHQILNAQLQGAQASQASLSSSQNPYLNMGSQSQQQAPKMYISQKQQPHRHIFSSILNGKKPKIIDTTVSTGSHAMQQKQSQASQKVAPVIPEQVAKNDVVVGEQTETHLQARFERNGSQTGQTREQNQNNARNSMMILEDSQQQFNYFDEAMNSNPDIQHYLMELLESQKSQANGQQQFNHPTQNASSSDYIHSHLQQRNPTKHNSDLNQYGLTENLPSQLSRPPASAFQPSGPTDSLARNPNMRATAINTRNVNNLHEVVGDYYQNHSANPNPGRIIGTELDGTLPAETVFLGKEGSLGQMPSVQGPVASGTSQVLNQKLAKDAVQSHEQDQGLLNIKNDMLTVIEEQKRHRKVQLNQVPASSSHQKHDTDDESAIEKPNMSSNFKKALNSLLSQQRPTIKTQLFLETWLWEKEQSHRLFNFQEGYRVLQKGELEDGKNSHGSCFSRVMGINHPRKTECQIIGSHIIQKNGPNDILVQQAHEYRERVTTSTRDEKKLINIVFHDGDYYLHEPRNKNENEDNIIDNHLWYIVKFMPKRNVQVRLGDVIRFGRIPFKIVKLVLDVQKELQEDQMQKDQLANVIAKSQAQQTPATQPNHRNYQTNRLLDHQTGNREVIAQAEGGEMENALALNVKTSGTQVAQMNQIINQQLPISLEEYGEAQKRQYPADVVLQREQDEIANANQIINRKMFDTLEVPSIGDDQHLVDANGPQNLPETPNYSLINRNRQRILMDERQQVQCQSADQMNLQLNEVEGVESHEHPGTPDQAPHHADPDSVHNHDYQEQQDEVEEQAGDHTSLSAAQTHINQFVDDASNNNGRVSSMELEESEAGFGRAEGPGQNNQMSHSMHLQDHIQVQDQMNDMGHGRADHNTLENDGVLPDDFEAAQSHHSFQSSNPDDGWIQAQNDQLISIKSFNQEYNSYHKLHADYNSLSGLNNKINESPYTNMINDPAHFQNPGAPNMSQRAKVPLNESQIPLNQHNSTHMLVADESCAEIIEQSTVMQTQAGIGTHRQTGRELEGQAQSNLPPISFTTGIQKREGIVRGGLGATLYDKAQPHISEVTSDASKKSNMVCRICLEEEQGSQNPFITPCKCVGSVRYIHVNCVREWLDSKKQAQLQDGVYSYYWEELTCELCKKPLQLRNQVLTSEKGSNVKVTKEYFLLNYKVPQMGKYMVLESDINCLSKAIHVIDFEFKSQYKVGRRVNNEITVSDISVSRAQAQFYLKDKSLFVEDLDSKFGTFVKIQGILKICSESMGLKPNEELNYVLPIQIEKKCFFIKPVQRYSCWLRTCCFFCFQKQLCSCASPSKSRKAPGQLKKGDKKTKEDKMQSTAADNEYDHFVDVFDRYPVEIYRQLLPELYQVELIQTQKKQKQKQKSKQKEKKEIKQQQQDISTQKKANDSPIEHQYPPNYEQQSQYQQDLFNQGCAQTIAQDQTIVPDNDQAYMDNFIPDGNFDEPSHMNDRQYQQFMRIKSQAMIKNRNVHGGSGAQNQNMFPRPADSVLSPAPDENLNNSQLHSYHNPLSSLQMVSQSNQNMDMGGGPGQGTGVGYPQRQSQQPQAPQSNSLQQTRMAARVMNEHAQSANEVALVAAKQYNAEMPPNDYNNQMSPRQTGNGRFRNNYNNSSID